jgi:hypothetical protein
MIPFSSIGKSKTLTRVPVDSNDDIHENMLLRKSSKTESH